VDEQEASTSQRCAALQASWEANAAAWTAAVRGGEIPSRRAGTDAAILRACARHRPRSVLDVGCGEGWLTHALAADAREVVGIDASPTLVAHARAARDPGDGPASGVRFEVLDYETVTHDPMRVPGPWDVIVCNFALLDDPVAPLLAALGARLAPAGRLLIQTVHPWVAAGEGPYVSGWREETFAGFGRAFPARMPWYFRTLGAWLTALGEAGLVLTALEEPSHPATGRPLSLLLEGAAVTGRIAG
jgi:2-polyprenyl-3-methyl-5-hydroxy-6-metoxy-1,4-benzoquinol methylase